MTAPDPLTAPAILHRRPRISVLIPAYNHAAYIDAAIASVLVQDWPDIELLVLDDGSTDDTLEVAQRAVSGERRVRCRLDRQDNAGVSATLNRLMEMADGDALAILNSDDAYVAGRLSRTMAQVGDASRFFAFTEVNFIESGSIADRDAFAGWYETVLARLGVLPSAGFALLLANITISSSNFIFSRDLAADTGGFDPSLPLTQDWDFVMRCLHQLDPILVPERLLNYRVHPTNSFRSHHDTRFAQSTAVLQRYFNPATPIQNPQAPSHGGWPRLFPLFLCLAPPVIVNARLADLLRQFGQTAHWPRLPGAPDEAAEREAMSRLVAAAMAET